MNYTTIDIRNVAPIPTQVWRVLDPAGVEVAQFEGTGRDADAAAVNAAVTHGPGCQVVPVDRVDVWAAS